MNRINVAIVAFNKFTDIDVYLLWDLLNRIKDPAWNVRIISDEEQIMSTSGLPLKPHGPLKLASESQVVLVASGPGTREKYIDQQFLAALQLRPSEQMIGSMCSGALILAAKGLLKTATTYPSAKTLLESLGVEVVERPFVENGNVATAAGCLSAQYLAHWVIAKFYGHEIASKVVQSIQPVAEGLRFADSEIEKQIAAARTL